MQAYIKTMSISPGFWSNERIITVPTVDGESREHFVDVKCMKGDLVKCWVQSIRGDERLVDLSYCCDRMRCWVKEENVVYVLPTS
jgi:hypothetical protein